jgi:TPR repeat protein
MQSLTSTVSSSSPTGGKDSKKDDKQIAIKVGEVNKKTAFLKREDLLQGLVKTLFSMQAIKSEMLRCTKSIENLISDLLDNSKIVRSIIMDQRMYYLAQDELLHQFAKTKLEEWKENNGNIDRVNNELHDCYYVMQKVYCNIRIDFLESARQWLGVRTVPTIWRREVIIPITKIGNKYVQLVAQAKKLFILLNTLVEEGKKPTFWTIIRLQVPKAYLIGKPNNDIELKLTQHVEKINCLIREIETKSNNLADLSLQFKKLYEIDIGLQTLAADGDVAAQYHLALCYEVFRKNNKLALEWYLRSAEGGYIAAQLYLAECYREGKPALADKDEKQALALHSKTIVEKQELVDKDKKQAFNWYLKAAEKGDSGAQQEVAQCFASGRWGITKDEKRARYWQLRTAAEKGESNAQYELAECYANGQGVELNKKQALFWYQKAVNQQHAAAQFKWGECYEQGDGVNQDEKEAIAWYGKAAEQNYTAAQEKLNKKLFLVVQDNQSDRIPLVLAAGADPTAHLAQGDVIALTAQRKQLRMALVIAGHYRRIRNEKFKGVKEFAVYARIVQEISAGQFGDTLHEISDPERDCLIQLGLQQDDVPFFRNLLNKIPNAQKLIAESLLRQAIDQRALHILQLLVEEFTADPTTIRSDSKSDIQYALTKDHKDEKNSAAAVLLRSAIVKRMVDPTNNNIRADHDSKLIPASIEDEKRTDALPTDASYIKDTVTQIDELLATSFVLQDHADYKACFTTARALLALSSDEKCDQTVVVKAYEDEKIITLYKSFDEMAEKTESITQDYKLAMVAARTKQKLLLNKRQIEINRHDAVDRFFNAGATEEKSIVLPSRPIPSASPIASPHPIYTTLHRGTVSDDKTMQVFVAGLRKIKLLSYFSNRLNIVDSILSFVLKLSQIRQQGFHYRDMETLVAVLIAMTNPAQLALFNAPEKNWLYLLQALLRKDETSADEIKAAQYFFPKNHAKFSALLTVKQKLWQFTEEKMETRLIADCVEPVCQLFDVAIDLTQPSLMAGLLLMLRKREQEAITCFYSYLKKEAESHYAAVGGLATLAILLLGHKFPTQVSLTASQVLAAYFNHLDIEKVNQLKAFFELTQVVDEGLQKAQQAYNEKDNIRACNEITATLVMVADYYKIPITEQDKIAFGESVKKYFPLASLHGATLFLSHQYPLLILFSHVIKSTRPNLVELAQKILCYAEIIRGMDRLEASHGNSQRLQVLLETGWKIAQIQNAPKIAALFSSVDLALQVYSSLATGNVNQEKLTAALIKFKRQQNNVEVNLIIGIALVMQSLYKITAQWRKQVTASELIKQVLLEAESLAGNLQLEELINVTSFGHRLLTLYESLTASAVDHTQVLASFRQLELLVRADYQSLLRSLMSAFFAIHVMQKMSTGSTGRFTLLAQSMGGFLVIWNSDPALIIGAVLAEHWLRVYEKMSTTAGGYEQIFKPILLALNEARINLDALSSNHLVNLSDSDLYQFIAVSNDMVEAGKVVVDVYSQVKELAGIANALGFDKKMLSVCLGSDAPQVQTLQRIFTAFDNGDAKQMQDLLPAAQQQFTGAGVAAEVVPAGTSGTGLSFLGRTLGKVSSFLPIANLAASCVGAYYTYKSTKQLEKVLELLPAIQKNMDDMTTQVREVAVCVENMRTDMQLYFKQVISGMDLATKRLEETVFSSTQQVIGRVELVVKIMQVNFDSLQSKFKQLNVEMHEQFQQDRFHLLEEQFKQIRFKLNYNLGKSDKEQLSELLMNLTDPSGVSSSSYNGLCFKEDVYNKLDKKYLISFLGRLFDNPALPNLYYWIKCCDYLNRLLKRQINNRKNAKEFIRYMKVYEDVINKTAQIIDSLLFANIKHYIIMLFTQLLKKHDENIVIRIKLIAELCNIPLDHVGETGFALWSADSKPEKAHFEKMIIQVFANLDGNTVNQSPYIFALRNIRRELINTGLQILGAEYSGTIQNQRGVPLVESAALRALPAPQADTYPRRSERFVFVRTAKSVDRQMSTYVGRFFPSTLEQPRADNPQNKALALFDFAVRLGISDQDLADFNKLMSQFVKQTPGKPPLPTDHKSPAPDF